MWIFLNNIDFENNFFFPQSVKKITENLRMYMKIRNSGFQHKINIFVKFPAMMQFLF